MAHEVSWGGIPHIKGPTESIRMAMLGFSLIGLQFTWGVEMTYFTPHLLELGLTKSQISIVWIAPPLSGLVVQPIIGAVSDSSTLRWGRRRPYVLVFSVLVAVCLCSLAWAPEIVGIFPFEENMAKNVSVTFIIFCVYAVDFAINAAQAPARSLVVDSLPQSQQQLGSAWAARTLGMGHVLGFLVGTVDLKKFFGNALGSSQFKQICVVASTTIILCSAVTCYCVEERAVPSRRAKDGHSGALRTFSTILTTTLHLPGKIQSVCWIAFWSWVGWFPFLVYGTTWVGETYYRQNPEKAEELRGSVDPVGDMARKGSFAFMLFSVISLAGSVFLPWVVKTPSSDEPPSPTVITSRQAPRGKRHKLMITTAWGLSQMAFSGAMILAPLSRSFSFSTILLAFCGLSWAMYGWAPLSIMGEEINKLESSGNIPVSYTSIAQDAAELELPILRSTSSDSMGAPSIDATNTIPAKNEPSLATAGTYLGIYNIYATTAQFIATFISMIAFSILEPGKSPELSNGGGEEGGDVPAIPVSALSGTAVSLAIGALCSLVAAILTFRLMKT